MNKKLSQRLSAALAMALPGKALWDICCDHGLLGVHAIRSQQFSQVHFVDQVPEIINQLENKIQKKIKQLGFEEGLPTKINFHTIPAESLKINLDGSLCVLGVGAEKINIFLKQWQKNGLLLADRLILGPNKDVEWFADQIIPELKFYKLTQQLDISEKGRNRKIFVLSRS